MTIAFGQGALNGKFSCWLLSSILASNFPGELGYGPDEPKSSTKPLQNKPLTGIDVIQCVPRYNIRTRYLK